jgi:hypothetical protein
MYRAPHCTAAGCGRGLCLIAALMACSGDDDGGTEAADRADPGGQQDQPVLRRELLDMMEADQAERTGEGTASGDESRTDRARGVRGGVWRRRLSGPPDTEQA